MLLKITLYIRYNNFNLFLVIKSYYFKMKHKIEPDEINTEHNLEIFAQFSINLQTVGKQTAFNSQLTVDHFATQLGLTVNTVQSFRKATVSIRINTRHQAIK